MTGLGWGRGAHSRLWSKDGRTAFVNAMRPDAYVADINERRLAAEEERLSPEAAATEMILSGLRLLQGLNIRRLKDRTGFELNESRLDELETAGLLQRDAQSVWATAKGRVILDTLAEQLCP